MGTGGLLMAVLLLTATTLRAEELDDIAEALATATGMDERAIKELGRQAQEHWQGEYVIPAAPVRALTLMALPWLEQQDETRPYAADLRTWLEETESADEFRVVIPPPRLELPVPPPPSPVPVPPPFWRGRVNSRSWPARAQALVPKLKPIFAEAGVPPELVWVAEIESGFNPRARSRAGAAGLFQLMPDTAEALDLSLWPRDERLDPDKNARASARYLKYLHAKFRDWPLSLAAYNGGEGRVRRLLGGRKRTFEEIAGELPVETRLYVPRIQAAILQREGALLSELPPALVTGDRSVPTTY